MRFSLLNMLFFSWGVFVVMLNFRSIFNKHFPSFLFWCFCRSVSSASVPRSDGHPAFLAEVKRSLPPEKSAELFQAISCYKKTDNYDNLVVNFLGLFKDNINLLVSKFTSTVIHPLNLSIFNNF